MNDLEKALKNLPQPNIPVEGFKRNLRAELLVSAPYSSRSRNLGFAISSFLASAFATLVVLFIINPQYPQQIHSWIDGNEGQMASSDANDRPSFDPPVQGANPVIDTAQAFSPAVFPSEEADRRYVERLLSQKSTGIKPRLEPAANQGVYSIREFISEDGKRVFVYTQIDKKPKPDPITVSY